MSDDDLITRLRRAHFHDVCGGSTVLLSQKTSLYSEAADALAVRPSPFPSGELIERVARAIDPRDWKIIDLHLGPKDKPKFDPDCRAITMRDESLARAKAAIEAIQLSPGEGKS